ncbi:MAG: prolipoprotein diacylglyceryl transferase [Actinobacteria bacterium]|nr:prolipoprotein diacylglyceryl transferase [Actinomycetota bacterium]
MRAATIPPPPADVVQIGPLVVHFYGLLIALGVLLAVTITRRRYGALGWDPEQVDRTAVWAVGLGFLGARLAYVSTHLGTFAGRPWAVLFVWEGGLALFGGLALGTAAAAWHLRREGGSIPALADAAAPAVPVAQALGRWGNYFNQELYGTPTGVPWALEVEPGQRLAPYARFATFHPTFLYESLWNLALAGLIVWIDARGLLRRRGSLFFVYLAGYGLGRFLVELLRTDTTFRVLGLSRNNWVALLVFLGGLAGLRWWERGAVGSRAPAPPR